MTDMGQGAGAHPDADARLASVTQRLAESEATLQALIAGHVDAVAMPSGPPVLLQEAQEALRQSEERYRDIVAHSPTLVCELAPDGTVRFANTRVGVLLGYRPSSLVGKNLWDVLVPEDRRSQALALWQYMQRGNVTDCEIPVFTSSGVERAFLWNATHRYARDGALESTIVFGLDISERKRQAESAERLAAEQAARAEAERGERRASLLAEVSRILSSSLDIAQTLNEVAGLVVPLLGDWCAIHLATDERSLKRVALRHADPARGQIFAPDSPAGEGQREGSHGVRKVLTSGKSELYADISEFLGAAARDAQQPELYEGLGLESAIVAPLRIREETVGTFMLVFADSGRTFEPADLATAEDLANRAAVAVENCRLYHESRAARTEAEEANRAKSEFLASMSHELRTPLNAVTGYVQLLDEEIQGPLNTRQRQYLSRVRLSAEHLLGLINGVLNFAKLEAGRVQFHTAPILLGRLLQDVDALIEPQVTAKGLTYEHTECASDLSVIADADKLRQIMLNLLSNAVKFTPRGGHIGVLCRPEGSMVTVTVRDSGIGIPADKLEAVFDPFVQIGKQAQREGTGLGLAISRELAIAMGGTLAATSSAEGATFILTVPIPEAP